MQVAVIESVGALDKLKLVERPEPIPGPGELLVRLRAASLNFRDLVAIEGGYGSRQKRQNLVPLSDGAGEIVAIGSGVDGWRVGDRVVSCFFPDWQSGPPQENRLAASLGGSVDGVACEFRAFGANAVLPVPDHLSFIEAATLPCAALTAWTAVVAQAAVAAGQWVLTQGTGGVSLFALQFAHAAGSDVIATSSSAEKMERLRGLGAKHVINYVDDPGWGDTAHELTDSGVDLVVEIGGAQTIAQSLRAVRMGGTVSIIGVVTGARPELNVPILIMKNIVLRGVSVGNREQFAAMLGAIVQHRLRPVVDRVFPLGQLRPALAYLGSRQHIGKVCIEI